MLDKVVAGSPDAGRISTRCMIIVLLRRLYAKEEGCHMGTPDIVQIVLGIISICIGLIGLCKKHDRLK